MHIDTNGYLLFKNQTQTHKPNVESLGGPRHSRRGAHVQTQNQTISLNTTHTRHDFIDAAWQVRAGCMCAGPYALRLLEIDGTLAKHYESALLQVRSCIHQDLESLIGLCTRVALCVCLHMYTFLLLLMTLIHDAAVASDVYLIKSP